MTSGIPREGTKLWVLFCFFGDGKFPRNVTAYERADLPSTGRGNNHHFNSGNKSGMLKVKNDVTSQVPGNISTTPQARNSCHGRRAVGMAEVL